MALFEAKGLHKRFGDQVVLENIDLTFEENKLNGIMGPNGAGKTTCFNLLTGHYTPNRGKVIFNGEDITGMAPYKILHKGVSRSFQIMNVFDEYTVLENVLVALPQVRDNSLNMIRRVMNNDEIMGDALGVLKKVGLNELAHNNAEDLSYGNRRALEIGLALASKPKMLFLDEPTAGLGTEATRNLAKLIQGIKKDLTIVIIEHDMHFLFGLADHIFVIHWGQVITQGTPDELRANKWVKASNLGNIS